MKNQWKAIQLAFSAAGAAVGWFLGEPGGLLTALMVFCIADYLTGVLCAIFDRRLSSAVGFRGICRKVLMFGMVGIGHMIDLYVIGSGEALRTAVIFFYISNEGISLIENAAHIGLPIPGKLKDVLAQLHDRAEEKEGEK